MDNVKQTVRIFTSQDAEHFLQRYPEKEHSLETFLLTQDGSALIQNLKTQSIVIGTPQHTLLATVNHKEYNNTHICSPYNIYIGYAKSSAKNFNSLWVRAFIYGFTGLFGKFFKLLHLNKVIQLNNTLSTISLCPEDISPLFPDMIHTLTQQYPKHAIIWPRINLLTDKSLCALLKTHDFTFIPTKTVHIFDAQREYMKIKTTKRDFAVLKKSDYTVAYHDDLSSEDMARIQILYEMLFIEKHSNFNPQFTVKYFQHCHRHKWFEFTALRNKDGVIDAFCSQTQMNNVMICGPSGYDTNKPTQLGLYRMIIWLNLNNAYQAKGLYNMGSGNELYKLNRGSVREMEYNAVYYQHLPFHRRLPWKILGWACSKVSTRIFKKHLL